VSLTNQIHADGIKRRLTPWSAEKFAAFLQPSTLHINPVNMKFFLLFLFAALFAAVTIAEETPKPSEEELNKLFAQLGEHPENGEKYQEILSEILNLLNINPDDINLKDGEDAEDSFADEL
jgi:hypothetical protein